MNESDLDIVCKIKVGSHLYGLNTENSDTDYKGVFLPTEEQILLNRIPKSITFNSNNSNIKNGAEDVDSEYYSLHYFMKLLSGGQTVAIEMLHASSDCTIQSSRVWGSLCTQREKFYTTNMSSFIGYARKQAMKYSVKASRMKAVEGIVGFLNNLGSDIDFDRDRLSKIWDYLPVGEHIHFIKDKNGMDMYQVCGKKIQIESTISYFQDGIIQLFNEFGKRVKKAKDNNNLDWKALSHALRIAYQMRDILVNKNMSLPIKERDIVMRAKLGQMDYLTEFTIILDDLMEEVEKLLTETDLPDKIDRKFWDNWLCDVIKIFVIDKRG